MRITSIRTMLGALAASLLLTTASAQAADAVRVGSKLDAEARLLGNIIVETLEAKGVPVESKLSLGPTKIVRTALISGEIDIYPEYTGNGAFFFNMDTNPVWKNLDKGYETIRALDAKKNKIVWLKPAPANNTWAIAVRKDVADANKLHNLADFARWVSGGGNVKIAASAEFVESPAALPAFEATYKFKLKPDQIVTLAGGDTAVTEKAAADQTSGVNAAMAYGTDGSIAALGLVALDDNEGAQIVYAPAPIVRAEVLAKYPDIKTSLEPIFATLNADTLRGLNAKISLEGLDAKQVAAAYLKEKGFAK